MAHVQETMALAMIMTNAPSSEVVATFKEAYGRYSHLTNSGTNKELVRYTTRAMMLAAEYAKQQGLFAEANYALMKAHYQVCRPGGLARTSLLHCTEQCSTCKSALQGLCIWNMELQINTVAYIN